MQVERRLLQLRHSILSSVVRWNVKFSAGKSGDILGYIGKLVNMAILRGVSFGRAARYCISVQVVGYFELPDRNKFLPSFNNTES